jgi:hypothetical protein
MQLMDNHSSLADEGSYFKALTTPGTGIVGPAQQTFVNTSALLSMATNATSGKRCYLDYIRLMCTSAPTAAINVNFAITVDSIVRGTSAAGTSLASNTINANMDSSRLSALSAINFGAITFNTTASPKVVFRGIAKTQGTPCILVGDLFSIDFGEHSQAGGLLSGSASAAYSISSGPIVFGPNSTLALHMWCASITVGPTFEVEVGWWER